MNRQRRRLQSSQTQLNIQFATKNYIRQDNSQIHQFSKNALKLRSALRKKNIAKVTQEIKPPPSLLKSFICPIKRSITQNFQCKICDLECKETPDIYVAQCQHKQSYCESCLHEYTIYRINQFQEVTCPSSDCGSPLQTDGKLFRELPAQKFYLTLNDPNAKMCPLQNCEGIIRREGQSSVMSCSKCESRFCSKCLMREHLGDCDEHQIIFLQRNLNYRRCVQCKMIIEKNQGCNHMTCRCGHQFCYVCGANWHPTHYNPHDSPEPAAVTQDRDEDNQDISDGCRYFRNVILFIPRVIISVLIAVIILVIFCIFIVLALSGMFGYPGCYYELGVRAGQFSAGLISRTWRC